MSMRGSMRQATAGGAANAATTARLSRDVLASVLLLLPASDLRRSRRVCKEWRDTISDPSFIDAHVVHGPRAPTHTVVFFPGRSRSYGAKESQNGGGFLFDEQWRLTARFTTGETADMVGTCNGLLCFLDSLPGAVKVVDPFTGESIVLPLPLPQPPNTVARHRTRAYCFGFDATARRYKIVHNRYCYHWSISDAVEQELRVLTVGADEEWRTVRIACAAHGVSYGDPACGDGAVYWYSIGADGTPKYVRFDLATEEITSVERRLVDGRTPGGPISCRPAWWLSPLCVIGVRWFSEWEDGCWPHNINAVAHDIYAVTMPDLERLLRPHALQRGHLLLQEGNGALCVRRIEGSSMEQLDIGFKRLLIRTGPMEEEPAKSYRFVAVRRRRRPGKEPAAVDSSEIEVPVVGRLPYEWCDISTFAYVPTVSPASFALYLGAHWHWLSIPCI